jgi:hypothetical protein
MDTPVAPKTVVVSHPAAPSMPQWFNIAQLLMGLFSQTAPVIIQLVTHQDPAQQGITVHAAK